jgi:hypothetical protein
LRRLRARAVQTMANELKPLDNSAIKKFCDLCVWVHQVWMTRKIVFEGDGNIARFDELHFASYLRMLSVITQEYVLLQISMLHDPAVQGQNENLTLERVVAAGPWDLQTKASLEQRKNELDRFAGYLRLARNKVLAHIDLASSLGGISHGAFPDGADEQYFVGLQRFVDIAHDATFGGPHPLRIASECSDAQAFVAALVGARPRR